MEVAIREGMPAAFGAATVCEAFQQTVTVRDDKVALRTKGDATRITWREYGERVKRIAGALAGLGVKPGDAVAILMINRPEFNLVDMAAVHLGAVPFSVYVTSTKEQIEHLVVDSGARVAFTEKRFAGQLPAVEHVITIDGDDGGLAAFEAKAPPAGFDFEARWRAVTPESLLTLIYTSGTTGAPKGVELTHGNMMAQLRGIQAARDMSIDGHVISYLPHAHIADRTGTYYIGVALGGTVTACPDPRMLFEHVAEVHPTDFTGVPRIWEKLKAGLEAKFAADPAKLPIIKGAIDAGIARVRLEQAGQPVPEALAAGCARAEQMVFAPMRALLGFDRTRSYFTGAAPTPRDVLEFFHAINIPVADVWGMSELSCVATVMPRGRSKIGSVGTPMAGVEVKLADDGEVLVRGKIVMKGYRNQPAQTRETIDADGWLHTGDVGVIDGEGFLTIVDRKKEILINAAGKNMSPANIEATIKGSSPLIGQACVIGDARPYNVALLVLDPDGAMAFARAHELDLPLAKLVEHAGLLAAVDAAIVKANEQLSRVEQIKRFALLPDEWLPGGDELTPTMKLKRKPIAAKYAARIDGLYKD